MTAPTAEIARRRTFAIISHPDAGKTTLTEHLLRAGGAIQLARQGRAPAHPLRLDEHRGAHPSAVEAPCTLISALVARYTEVRHNRALSHLDIGQVAEWT